MKVIKLLGISAFLLLIGSISIFAQTNNVPNMTPNIVSDIYKLAVYLHLDKYWTTIIKTFVTIGILYKFYQKLPDKFKTRISNVIIVWMGHLYGVKNPAQEVQSNQIKDSQSNPQPIVTAPPIEPPITKPKSSLPIIILPLSK